MSSYLAAAQQNIKQIVEEIVAAEKSDVQFCLIQYRDHPPQDSTFIVKTSDWTGSVSKMKKYVDEMSAAGGGDGPEAVTAALYAARHLTYRKESVRVAVLIADAPPHGLGESGDGFPNGDPDGHDPIVIAKEMASLGIVIYSVAVEPGLGSFKYARDFMRALAKCTDGQFLPLTNAKLLPKVIAGGAAEELSLNKVAEEVEKEIEKLKTTAPSMSEEEMLRHATESLQKKGITTNQLAVEDVYTSAWNMGNVDAMSSGSGLAEARSKMKADLNAHVSIKAEYSGGSHGPSAYGGGAYFSEEEADFSAAPAAAYRAAPAAYGAAPPAYPAAATEQKVGYASSSISYEQVARLSSRSKKK
jgi:hypothetical protein